MSGLQRQQQAQMAQPMGINNYNPTGMYGMPQQPPFDAEVAKAFEASQENTQRLFPAVMTIAMRVLAPQFNSSKEGQEYFAWREQAFPAFAKDFYAKKQAAAQPAPATPVAPQAQPMQQPTQQPVAYPPLQPSQPGQQMPGVNNGGAV